MLLIGAAYLFRSMLPIISLNINENGCQAVSKIEDHCDTLCVNNTLLVAPCIAQNLELLGENDTITADKFLTDFVRYYTVNQTAFRSFTVTTRDCVESEVTHEPISNSDLWNLLECLLIPADELESVFGCKFPHPL